MPMYTYKCIVCGYEERYLVSVTDKDVHQICSECGKDSEFVFKASTLSSEVIGGYDNTLGKKAWRKQSPESVASVLIGEKSPY